MERRFWIVFAIQELSLFMQDQEVQKRSLSIDSSEEALAMAEDHFDLNHLEEDPSPVASEEMSLRS